MISLSDAIRLESNNPAVNTFKPWWEVAVDYTLNAFLLVVLFSLAGVTISGTPGLVCLPKDTNTTAVNYATNNYVNAKCTTHIDGHVLIVFPYIIFVQWLLLFVLHLSWFNLPALKAFLSSSFDTFTVFKQVGESRPQAKKRKLNDAKKQESNGAEEDELLKGDEDSCLEDDDDQLLHTGRNAQLVHLVDWLQYLLQFQYNLVNIYTAKSLTTCVFTAIIVLGITSWLVTFRWKAAFTCDLRGSLPPPYDHNVCSFPAAPYVYSMMILNVIFAILLFFFNLRALLWLAKFKISFRRYFSRTWRKAEHPLRDKPGFFDYFFCVKLLKYNSPEGVVVFETMELAFKAFGNKTPEETEAASEVALMVPELPSYRKDRFIVSEVLRELGLVHKRSLDSRDDLWVALANSVEGNTPTVPRAVRDVQDKVVGKLLEKQVLFKDLINKDNHCPVFEEYIEDIKEGKPRESGMIEDHYILMAFAIVYSLNVVVIRAEKSSLLYEPEHPEENQSVRFITFVSPRYYYASTTDPHATAEQKDTGLVFLTDQTYQTSLMKKVSELWESKGYEEYKRTLGNILPQELAYPSDVPPNNESQSDLEEKSGLRFRFRKSKEGGKIEHLALVETVPV